MNVYWPEDHELIINKVYDILAKYIGIQPHDKRFVNRGSNAVECRVSYDIKLIFLGIQGSDFVFKINDDDDFVKTVFGPKFISMGDPNFFENIEKLIVDNKDKL